MRHIFVDLGCYDGDTIQQFRNWRYLKYPKDQEWLMFGFDPNPDFLPEWERHTRDDTVFEQSAAWTEDGEITFSSNKVPYKSTVMKEKSTYSKGSFLTVPCFDFSSWLEQFRGDHVIIKMDIEGAELPVLTKMIMDKTDNVAEVTMVEWHDGKMPTYESNKGWIWDNYRGKLVEWR